MRELLWYPLFAVVVLGFTVNVPASYLAGVVACLDEERIHPLPLEDILAKEATDARICKIQAKRVWVS